MASTYPLPDAAKIKVMLGCLFDGLEVKPGKKFDITPSSGSWVALYVTDESKPAALCVADGPLAANSSAALSMLPPNTAKDAIKSKDLPSAMVANLREIMNICSRLLMTDSSPHLRLAALHAVKSMPADLSAVIGSAHNRFDFEIQVPKYGVGNLAFIST